MFRYKKDAINRYIGLALFFSAQVPKKTKPASNSNFNNSTRPLNMKIIKNLLFGLSNISTNISDTLDNGSAKKGTFVPFGQKLYTHKIKDFDSVGTPQQRLKKFRKSLGYSNLTRASAHSYIKAGRYATGAYVVNNKQVRDLEPFLRFGFGFPAYSPFGALWEIETLRGKRNGKNKARPMDQACVDLENTNKLVCSKGTLWRRRCWSFETKDQQRLLQTGTRSSFPKSLKKKTFLSYWLLPLIGLFTLVVPNKNVVMQNLSIGQNNNIITLLCSQNLQTLPPAANLINGPEAIASLAWAKKNTKSNLNQSTLKHSNNLSNPLTNNMYMVRTNPVSSFNQLYKVLGFNIARSADNILKAYPDTCASAHNFFKLFLSKNFMASRYQAHTFVLASRPHDLPMQTVTTFALKTNYSNNLLGKHATHFFDFSFALASAHGAKTNSDKFKQSYVNNSRNAILSGQSAWALKSSLKNHNFTGFVFCPWAKPQTTASQTKQNSGIINLRFGFFGLKKPAVGFLNKKKPLPITSYKAALAFLNKLIYNLNWDTLRNTPFYTSNLGTKLLRSPKLDNKLLVSTQESKNLDKILQFFYFDIIKNKNLQNNLINFNNSIFSLDKNFSSGFGVPAERELQKQAHSGKQNLYKIKFLKNYLNSGVFILNSTQNPAQSQNAKQKQKLVTSFNLGAYGLNILNSYMLFGAQNPQKMENAHLRVLISKQRYATHNNMKIIWSGETKSKPGGANAKNSFQKGFIKLHNPILTTSFSSKICSVQKTRLSQTNKTVSSEAKWFNRKVSKSEIALFYKSKLNKIQLSNPAFVNINPEHVANLNKTSKSNNFLTEKQQSEQNQRAIDNIMLEKNNISRIFSNYIRYLRKNLNKFIKLNKYNTTQILYNYLPKKPIQYEYNATEISKTKHFKVTQDVTWLKAGTRTSASSLINYAEHSFKNTSNLYSELQHAQALGAYKARKSMKNTRLRGKCVLISNAHQAISKNIFQNSIPIVLQHKKFFMLKPLKKSIVNRVGFGAKRQIQNLPALEQTRFYYVYKNSDNTIDMRFLRKRGLVNYWPDTQNLIKKELLSLASLSKNKTNQNFDQYQDPRSADIVWTNLQELNKYKKEMQKKRRAKKQRLEARRKTKRRRFYPRPIWLRLRLGLSLYKTKTTKTFALKNSNNVRISTRASAQKDYLNNYIQTLAKGNLKINMAPPIILKDKLNDGLSRPAKTYQLAANTTAYNNIVYNLWLAAKKAKTAQSAVTNSKNKKNKAKGNVAGLKELRATRPNFVSIYNYKKKVLINQMLGKTTKQNLIKFKNTASYANFEEKSTQNIPKKDINKNSLRDFWIWLYNLTSTNLINKQIYINNILNYFSIPIISLSENNLKNGQKSVGLGLDYTVSDTEALESKARINNIMMVPETEHFLQPLDTENSWQSQYAQNNINNINISGLSAEQKNELRFPQSVWTLISRVLFLRTAQKQAENQNPERKKLKNKPISLAFNQKTLNRVKWSLNKTNLWASTNQRMNYWSTQKLRRQSKNNKTKYFENKFKKQLNNLFTNLKLKKFFDVSLENQTLESLRTNPAAANQNILKNYKIAIRSASQKMHQKQMKLSYITSGAFSAQRLDLPLYMVSNNSKHFERFGGIEFSLLTSNFSNAFALRQGFLTKPSNKPWFKNTSFRKNSNSFAAQQQGFDFSNITGTILYGGTRASVPFDSVNHHALFGNQHTQACADFQQQNTQTINSNWPITIFSLLLHFSALISLISISQIRCFMKFHFILIYKLSNLYLQIIYKNLKLFMFLPIRLGAKKPGETLKQGSPEWFARVPNNTTRDFRNLLANSKANVDLQQKLSSNYYDIFVAQKNINIGQDSKSNIAASKETSFAKLGFFKKAPALNLKDKMLSKKIKASYQNYNPNYCKNLIYVSFLQKIIKTKALKLNNQSSVSFSKNGLPKANNNINKKLVDISVSQSNVFSHPRMLINTRERVFVSNLSNIYKITNFLITFLLFFKKITIEKPFGVTHGKNVSSTNKEKSLELQRKRNFYTSATNISYNFYKNSIKVKNFNYEYIGTLKKETYDTTLKIVDTFEYFLRLVYGFFEKPAELTMDWIAYAFLVEWSSDLLTFTPENKDKQNWLAFSKFSRQTQPLFFYNIMDGVWPYSKIMPVGLMASAGATFILSTAISRFLYKRLMYLNEIFIEILNRPDTDLINRQKKGTLFWDVWSDILIKAADQYNINVPSLSNIKEEQNLLIDKFLSENQKTDAVKLNNKFELFIAKPKISLAFQKIASAHLFSLSGLSLKKSLIGTNQSARHIIGMVEEPFGVTHSVTPNGSSRQLSYKSLIYPYKLFGTYSYRKNINFNIVNQIVVSKLKPINKINTKTKAENQKQKLAREATNFININKNTTYMDRLKAPFDDISSTEFVTYQSKETDLFLDYHPPKSLAHLSSIKYYGLVQQPIGTLVCQIYSGIFNKQISKNILVIGSILSQNGVNLKARLEPAELRMQKTLLIQALAGETEIKIITDNAQRYAIVNRGFAVGIKLLKEVFESLALNTPCLFLLEDIHLIGERRPLLISDHGDSLGDEMSKSTEIAFGSQRNGDAVHEKNKILYQYNRHGITHYQKPFKGDFSLSIPTNHFAFDLYFKQRNANLRQKTPISPLAYGINFNGTNQELTSENSSSKSNQIGSSEKISSSNIQSVNQHYSSSLQLSKNKLLSPPSTSPFTVLLLKEQKKLKQKKIVKELPWVGLPSEQLALLPRVSYSVRAKVAALADLNFSNMSAKFDMITDLLVIIDSVRGNRGFVVFATTHLPHILDPALRRPGRLDETIAIPTLSNLWNRWEFTKVSQPDIYFNSVFRSAFRAGFSACFCAQRKNKRKIQIQNATIYSSLSRFGFAHGQTQQYLTSSGGVKKATASNLFNNFSLDGNHKVCDFLAYLPGFNFSRYISNNFVGYHGTIDSLDFLNLDFLPNNKTNILSPILTNLPRKLTRNKHTNTLSMQLQKSGSIQKISDFKNVPTCTNIAPIYYQMGRKLIRNWIWGTQSFGSTGLKKAEHNLKLMAGQAKPVGKQNNLRTVWNILNFSPLYNNTKINHSSYARFGLRASANQSALLTENIEFLSTEIKYKSIYSTTHIIKNTLIGLISGKFSELFAFKTMPILALFNKNFKISEKALVKANTNFFENPKQNFQSGQNFNLLANQQHNNMLNKQIDNKVINKLGHGAKAKIFGKQQITLYGIDQTWRAAMSLALSFVQKRYLYHKNLIVPKLLNFVDNASLEEAPSPPFSNILIPAKRYENYKKVFKENIELNLYNNTAFGSSGQVLSNKLEKHLKQSFIQSIYKKGSKQHYLDKEFKNSKFQKLRFLETIPNANQLFRQTTNISWYYENKILKRHKNYLTNQWWNGQLIEHNAETLFLSDIDWRYTFYYSNSDFAWEKTRAKIARVEGRDVSPARNSNNTNLNIFGNKENKKINQANLGTLSSERTPKDILLDFPDSDQHYNPKHRRWILNSGYWSSWFDFDKKLQTEILNNFIFECFITSYNILNLNRELLDYSVTKYMQKGLIKEINMIGLVSRLGCNFQTFASNNK